MAMHQQLIPKMSQQLRMTPQLQQAIKLLQLSRMDLINLVQQEMVENPVLEEMQEPYVASKEREAERKKEEAREDDSGVAEVEANANDMDKIDWENYIQSVSSSMPSNDYRGLSSADLPGVEETLSTSTSLVDHLLEQLRMADMDEDDKYLALLIIGNLDEAGYMRGQTVEEMAEASGEPLERVEAVLDVLQTFDPLGVCARDLRECLLIQLERLHPHEDIAYTLVENHIPDLERKSYSKIARTLGVDVEDVYDGARLISTLEPRPGRAWETSEPRYITPDIYIRRSGVDYVAVLNEDGLPKLKISGYYKRELQRKRADGEKDEVKDYIQDKLRGAAWLIRSIHQRQSTIVKVTESIIKFQRDFFDYGVEHLKPLVLRDVAEDIGMHESTVSRVTSNKYVHTPRGIFELKYFFNSSITRHGGHDLASEAVKAKIRDLISDEDPKKPLSDSKIVKLLAEENIDIARRTVAKYREMMGILSSAKRKQVF
jgi:RNA polymerase sigma-54 factor